MYVNSYNLRLVFRDDSLKTFLKIVLEIKV